MPTHLSISLHHSLVRCARSEALSTALQDCRRQTLSLAKSLSADLLNTQAHPDFSPIGWHLGHIAYTESLWIIDHLVGAPRPFLQWDKLFAADGLPKAERQNLPTLEILLDYLETVRVSTLRHLEQNDPAQAACLWHWLIQHESQHVETATMVLAMQQVSGKETSLSLPFLQTAAIAHSNATEMVFVEPGEFLQGCDDIEAIDNERPARPVWTAGYWIDRTPVTCTQYQQFIEAGGYQTEQWWSPEGWHWQQQAKLSTPLYWSQSGSQSGSQSENADNYLVCGVSWYEADAYARFAGKRLPTESEWEKAVSAELVQGYSVGSIWEWTDTWFDGYPEFQPFPYKGYSQTYFDSAHRVLKGSSWATPKWLHRPSFRNWYHPHRRELFAGFRCAK